MLRKNPTFSRLALLAALAAAVGCSADNGKKLSDQPVGPVAPTGIAISVSASKSSLVATTDTTSTLTVRAIRTDTGSPVADFSKITITTSLGALDNASGGQTVTLETINGQVTTNLYPGTVAGTARIRATLQSAIGLATVTIRPAPEEPTTLPPVASNLTLQVQPTFVTGGDGFADTLILTATVIGSDGKKIKNAGVLFTTPVGTIGTTDTVKTGSDGVASNSIDVTDGDIDAAPGSSFTVTAKLAVEGGGYVVATFNVTIVRGDAPPTPTKVTLSSDQSFINDDGSNPSLSLSALVQDQYGSPFQGGTVTFSSSFASVGFSPNPVDSDGSGIAASTASVTGANVAAFPSSSFTITATLATSTGTTTSTITITIVRAPQAAFSFNGQAGSYTVNFVNQSQGGNLTYDWDFDTTVANTDSALANPQWTYPAAPASFTVRLTVTNSAGSSTVFHTVNVPNP